MGFRERIITLMYVVPFIGFFVILSEVFLDNIIYGGKEWTGKKISNILKKILWWGFGIIIVITSYNNTLSRAIIGDYIVIRGIVLIMEILIKRNAYDEKGYNIRGYDREGFDKDGFNELGIHKDTGGKYNSRGYNKEGYNKKGFNELGIHKDTGIKYDKKGFDKRGFNELGINKDTGGYRDKDGYDKNGYDIYRFNRNGHFLDFFTYDHEGFDVNGWNKKGYNREGYDKDGYDVHGWNKKGIHKITGRKYDENGLDRDGLDKDGFNISGLDKDGFDKKGFKHTNYYLSHIIEDKYPYNEYPYDGKENKYTGTMYDKDGLDYYGNSKETKKVIKKSTTKTTNKNIGDNKSKSKTKGNIEFLKICSIASGSNGNCYYIGTDDESILIDDGISYKQLSLRMKEANLNINSVKGIFISHEHVDHIRGLPIFYKNHPNVPIYFNEKAYRSVSYSNNPSAYRRGVVNLEERVVNLGGFKIYPFKKKHDASYPLSFRVEYNGISVGIFTDIGEHSTTFRTHFSKCNAVFLEANHDVTMLRNCSRPRDVIDRIYETHFSNDNAYDMLNDYASPDLQVVILVHISEDNNSNRKIMEKFAKFEKKYKLEIASRYGVGKVYNITN